MPVTFSDVPAIYINAKRESEVTDFQAARETLQAQLTLPCIDWIFSETDSAVEKRAETQIDEVFSGETDYRSVCKFILN